MPTKYYPRIANGGLSAHYDAGSLKCFDPKENLLLQSNGFNAQPWSIAEYVYTTGSIAAPDGTLTGVKVVNNSNANNFNFNGQLISTTVGGIYTFSIHIKNIDATNIQIINGINNHTYNSGVHWVAASNSVNVFFDNASAIVGYGQSDAGNGWTRIWISTDMTKMASYYSATISTVSCAFYIGPPSNTSSNHTKSCYFWGGQHERNLKPSAHAVTTGSQYLKSTTLNDLSGNGNNLTAQSYPAWSSDFGGFFRTQADGHWLGNGNASLPLRNSQYTLSCWARFPTTWNDGVGYMSISDMASINYQANYLKNTAGVGQFANNWWANNILNSSNTAGLQVNKWFLITATYNGVTRSLYANETLLNSDTPIQNHNVVNSSIRLARGWENEWLNGDISAAYIYNRSLTAAEVSRNYNMMKSRFGL